jgi:hypothetical protein
MISKVILGHGHGVLKWTDERKQVSGIFSTSKYGSDVSTPKPKTTQGRIPSSGMWCRVDLVWTDVSEESITSIFRVEKSESE